MSQRHWIQTYTGRAIDPLNPRVQDISIRDIAHALSQMVRYTGHTREFYSVAEHSWHVSYLVPREHALWGLLHDASEAYLADIASPVKRRLRDVDEIESRLQQVIALRFGLPWPMPEAVHIADHDVLVAERDQAMGGERGGPWNLKTHTLPHPCPVETCPVRLGFWQPKKAKATFLGRFSILDGRDEFEPPRYEPRKRCPDTPRIVTGLDYGYR